ncbi:MAG: phosphatidylserine decarboxylase [Candidatus Thermoplasmatota archaeon]|nr:phosphatidylserine decarboxylase [Candidatus Thermoplasmatota archaeon]
MQIAQGGSYWILTAVLLFVVVSLLSFFMTGIVQRLLFFLSVILALISILLIIFFRDPDRKTGNGIVAVADGIIRAVNSIQDEDVGNAFFVSTFMNIYHVHVNRMPVDGTIKKITHIPGSHLPAFTKESERNERVIMLVETAKGLVKIILIAGTVARRIVPYVKNGEHLKKGEKISLIRLGSRVDVILPKKMNVEITVTKKDRVIAGVNMIAASNA